MPYVGSKEQLNGVTGIAAIIPLTESLETEYSNKIFKANFLFWKESTGLIYRSDGVKSLAHLDDVTITVTDALNAHATDTNLHVDADLKSRIVSTLDNVATLSNTVNTLSANVDTHLNDTDIHVSANYISSTYATKQELAAITGVSGTYVTVDQLEAHTTDPDLHPSGAMIASTYATKEEVADLADVYATTTDLGTHANNTDIHISAADRAAISSIADSASISAVDLDDMLISLYS
jgi:hypothetical protein